MKLAPDDVVILGRARSPVGDFLGAVYERSKLYDPAFTTEFREATQ